MRAPSIVHLAALLPAAAGLGCPSIDRYSTAPGESYCGTVTANAEFFTGLAPGATMRLTLHAAQIDGDASPGMVWTREPPAGSSSGRRLVDGAPLRRIPTLANDPLASPDLGSGLDHTRVFALTPAPAGEAPLLGVVSLRSDEGVEVRLLRPGLEDAPALSGQAPVFGLFSLTKQAGACGF
jgi:hypothetical protein